MSDDRGQFGCRDDLVEYTKLGLFVLILMGALVIIALLRPVIVEQILPAALGLNLGQGGEAGLEASPSVDSTPTVGTEQEPVTASATETVHTVREDESLRQIAVLYGVSVESIAAANNLISAGQLKAGTELIIPKP